MAVMLTLGPCFCCHEVFAFNHRRVPAYRGEPVCRECMARVNAKRAAMGLPPHEVLSGAYDADEEEGGQGC